MEIGNVINLVITLSLYRFYYLLFLLLQIFSVHVFINSYMEFNVLCAMNVFQFLRIRLKVSTCADCQCTASQLVKLGSRAIHKHTVVHIIQNHFLKNLNFHVTGF